MRTFCLLLKRDMLLIKANVMKRMLIVFFVSFVLNVLSAMRGNTTFLVYSLAGVDALSLKNNPAAFPIFWILIQMSGILVSYDFVKDDLFEYATNIIPKIGRRRLFWESKMMAGVVISGMLTFLYFVSCTFAEVCFLHLFKQGIMDWRIYVASFVRMFIGIFIGYCLYQVISILCKEVIGVLVVLVFFCFGITSESSWIPLNHMMLMRSLYFNEMGSTTVQQNIIFYISVIVVLFLAGIWVINSVDIFSRKDDE